MSTENILINNLVTRMKREYEDTILEDGRVGVTSLIRSQRLIGYVHEYIKEMLIHYDIPNSKIFPPLGSSKPELSLPGFLKTKNQDICVLPEKLNEKETISKGVLEGKETPYTMNILRRSISINVRSQLSSLAKNFDTLFERTFAEAFNLHMQIPELIMGEVYVVPLIAYDPDAIAKKEIAWRERLPFKYIPAFSEISNRSSASNETYKYERLALLIIDFRENPPKIIETAETIAKINNMDVDETKKYSLKKLSLRGFVKDILDIYKKRHGLEEYEKLLSK